MRFNKIFSAKNIVISFIIIMSGVIIVGLSVVRLNSEAMQPSDKSSIEQLSDVSLAMQLCMSEHKSAQLSRERRDLTANALGLYKRISAPKDSIDRCGSAESLIDSGYILNNPSDVTIIPSDDGKIFMAYIKTDKPTNSCSEENGIEPYSIRVFYEGGKSMATTECHRDGSVPQMDQMKLSGAEGHDKATGLDDLTTDTSKLGEPKQYNSIQAGYSLTYYAPWELKAQVGNDQNVELWLDNIQRIKIYQGGSKKCYLGKGDTAYANKRFMIGEQVISITPHCLRNLYQAYATTENSSEVFIMINTQGMENDQTGQIQAVLKSIKGFKTIESGIQISR